MSEARAWAGAAATGAAEGEVSSALAPLEAGTHPNRKE